MNVECTYNGEIVNIVGIEPNQKSGYVNIIYVDSENILRLAIDEYSTIIATGCTII